MYKKGCTLKRTYTPSVGDIYATLHVDSTSDFNVNDDVVVFWPGGSLNKIIFDKTDTTLVLLGPLPSLQKYSGVRPSNNGDVYSCSRIFLDNALGTTACGDDGGGFVEFKLIDNPNSKVPRYSVFDTEYDVSEFASFWFDNALKQNVTDLLICSKRYSQRGTIAGTTFPEQSICAVFADVAVSALQLEDSVAHEFGHRFFIRPNRQNNYKHVDSFTVHQLAHDGNDECLMSYNRNRGDANAELCVFCLLLGSQANAADSIRKVEDK